MVLFHLVDAERIYGRGFMLLDGVARLGFAGVDVFFVISGFVMATIAGDQYGSLRKACRFLARRAVRILPLYWVFTSLIVLILIFLPGAVDASFHTKSMIASYLLWPQREFPLLQVGWTLIYEAFFYLMMAFALAALDERRAPWYLLVWALAVGSLQFAPVSEPWQVVVTSPMAWEFIAGALVGLYWRRIPTRLGRPSFWLGAVGFAVAMFTLSRLGFWDQDQLRRTLVFGSCSTAIVLGLVVRERARNKRPHVWLRVLGDASFSIYLSHLFVITACARIWGRSGLNSAWPEHVAFIAVTMAASVAAGVICYHLIERPLFSITRMASTVRPLPVAQSFSTR